MKVSCGGWGGLVVWFTRTNSISIERRHKRNKVEECEGNCKQLGITKQGFRSAKEVVCSLRSVTENLNLSLHIQLLKQKGNGMKYLSKLVWVILPKLMFVVKITGGLLFFSVLWMSVNVSAATFTVDTTADGADGNPGDGFCSSLTNGQCTLRAAIQEANAWAENDIIDLPAGIYLLTEAGENEDDGFTGDLDIHSSGDLIIRGVSTKDTIIDGNNRDRVIHIHDTAETITLTQLTVRGGRSFGPGGGIYNSGPSTLLLSTEIIENWSATVNARVDFQIIGPELGAAGGIYNDIGAELIVDQSYIGYNNARNSPSNVQLKLFDEISQLRLAGGGIYNAGFLEVRNNSRIEDNIAQQGGGIANFGTADVTDSIVAFNFSRADGGGILNWGGVLNVRRSIVSDNRCGTCSGAGIANHPGTNEFDGDIQIGRETTNSFSGHTGVAVIIASQVENNGGGLSIGIGIANTSQMYIGYSSISWNRGSGIGMGISNFALGDLTIENSTIVGNHSSSLGAVGNGIETSSRLRLHHVTMTGNFSRSSTSFAQELYINTDVFDDTDPSNWVTIKNSVIGDMAYRQKLEQRPDFIASGSAADDSCGGGYSNEPDGSVAGDIIGDVISTDDYFSLIRSEGYNLSNDYSCGLTGTNDLPNVAPDLQDAGAYGGVLLPIGPFLPRVLSRPPASSSPVRDTIPDTHCSIAFDQRLHRRPSTGSCDIGAIEGGASAGPYADLQVSATVNQEQVQFGDDVTYTILIKNLGKDASNDLSGSGQPADSAGQPTKPEMMSTFTFLNLKIVRASFYAPDPTGAVSCEITATAENEEQAQCSYDRPLLPGTELAIYITVRVNGNGWSLGNSAEVNSTNPPDPVAYNNRVTLRQVTGIGPSSSYGVWTREDTQPLESGAASLGPLEMAILVILFLFLFIKRFTAMRAKNSFQLSISGTMIFLTSLVASAAVPTITNISPNVGSSTSDTLITIEGSGFDADVRIALLNDRDVSAVSARVPHPLSFPFSITRKVAKQNQYLYLDGSYGVFVFDVSNPLSPIVLERENVLAPFPRMQGGLSTSSRPDFYTFAVAPNNKFYGFYPGRLGIFDFNNNPTSPSLVHEFRVLTRKDGLHPSFSGIISIDMAIDGDLIYFLRDGSGGSFSTQPGLFIVDTSITTGANIVSFTQWTAPSMPRVLKYFSVPTSQGLKKYVLLAGGFGPTQRDIGGVMQDGSLFLFDVTDPTEPVAVGAYEGPIRYTNPELIKDVAIKLVPSQTGTKVYAIAVTRFAIAVYDISPDTGFQQTSPISVYEQFSPQLGWVKMDGDIAIVVDIGTNDIEPIKPAFWEFDVSGPTFVPKLVGGPYTQQGEDAPIPRYLHPHHWAVDDGFIYTNGLGFIFKTNQPLNIISVTPSAITATVPAGYRPQLYDLVLTNSNGGIEEVRIIDSFTIQ